MPGFRGRGNEHKAFPGKPQYSLAQASNFDTARHLASFLAKKTRFVTTSNRLEVVAKRRSDHGEEAPIFVTVPVTAEPWYHATPNRELPPN